MPVRSRRSGANKNAALIFLTLTYAEDVEAEPLGDRFTDQLVGEAVESDVSAQRQATLLFILEDPKKTSEGRSQLEQRAHKHTHGEDISPQ